VALKDPKSLEEALRLLEETDERLVRLLAQRLEYERRARRFRSVPECSEEVLARARNLAKINGLDARRAEKFYRLLMSSAE
jgi:chorismate mutase